MKSTGDSSHEMPNVGVREQVEGLLVVVKMRSDLRPDNPNATMRQETFGEMHRRGLFTSRVQNGAKFKNYPQHSS